jgi:hypothetical protein
VNTWFLIALGPLIPYLLAAACALKLTVTRETYGDGKSLVSHMVIAAVATVYTLFLVCAAGVDKLLLSCILYALLPRSTSRRAGNAVCVCSNPPRQCCSA